MGPHGCNCEIKTTGGQGRAAEGGGEGGSSWGRFAPIPTPKGETQRGAQSHSEPPSNISVFC